MRPRPAWHQDRRKGDKSAGSPTHGGGQTYSHRPGPSPDSALSAQQASSQNDWLQEVSL